ncbi:MAG TPA: ROK family protein [Solirubrobacteraceae bacterium]|jgi:fructokinase|nr:ROK family protein [Solirubrobacteraceae bacterium]
MSDIYGGVETGGTWCVCALGTGPDDLVAEETFRTTAPAQTRERIIAFFASRPRPRAIGIGAFGPVDLDEDSPTWGHVTTTPKPGWAHTALAGVIRDRLGVPVRFDTDVNAAAVGEHRWGAGQDVPSLCYLTVGTGVGAGIIIDGRPLHGLIHPEPGHLRIPHDRRQDPFDGACPVHGDCWEGLAAGGAIAARWGVPPDELADDHPAWALEAEYLALGIHGIVSIVSPHRVIVGGGVMERAGLLSRVRERLHELNAGYLDTPLLDARIDEYLVAPGLGDRAGVLGAIALAAGA